MIFYLELSGKIIEINSIYATAADMCSDYISKKQVPDIIIKIDESDIEQEWKAFMPEGYKTFRNEHRDGYMELQVIHRKIADAMLDFNTFLMHGSVVAVENEAFMITAKSGTGKTTRTRLWLENIAGSYVVNGDKPLIKVVNDQVLACGTPWCGKEHMNKNVQVPLKSIFILERSDDNIITEISFKEAFTKLLSQTYRPNDRTKMIKTINLLKTLNGKVKFFTYKSNLEPETVLMAYDASREKK